MRRLEGTLIKDRYLLEDELGAGGMGAVYRAVDTTSRETVAVKLLFDTGDDGALARALSQEARAVARLHHPNIIRLVDYGQAEAGSFLVMEYAPGQALTSWLGFLSMAQVGKLFDGVLSALAYAHARGVIHQDLKPDNILVVEDRSGELLPKLVDFGIARVADPNESLGGLDGTGKIRRIMGTPKYMAPEQAQGRLREVHSPADLYSIGVMLYQIVTGEVPFLYDNVMATIMAVVSDPVPPIEPLENIVPPPGLTTVILKLLAKRPTQRFGFAADVRRALKALDWNRASSFAPRRPATGIRIQRPAAMEATLDAPVSNETGLLKPLLDTSGGGVVDDQPIDESPVSIGLFGMREVPVAGRKLERQLLWAELESMLSESSVRIVVLDGAQGIGKSRLARWLAERAEEEGLIRQVRCGGGAASVVPGGGLRGLIDRHLRIHGVERDTVRTILREELVDTGLFEAGELEPLVDFLRPASDQHHAVLGTSSALDPVGTAARILRAATSRRPLVLWIDDLGGPDGSGLVDLIDLLAASRAFSPMPILVVATLRYCASPTDTIAHEALAKLAREEDAISWLTLHPLDADAVGELTSNLLPIEERTLRLLVERSQGYPRYLLQLIGHWLQEGHLEQQADGRIAVAQMSSEVPSTLAKLLQGQLGALILHADDPEAARAVVELAAVAGVSFELEILTGVLQRENRNHLIPVLDRVWGAMADAGLWHELDREEARWADLELHQHVVQSLVSPANAIKLHAALAETKGRIYREQGLVPHAELADHYEAAAMYDKAAEHLLRASRQARVWARFDHARELYDHLSAILDTRAVSNRLQFLDQINLGRATVALEVGDFDHVESELVAVEKRPGAGQGRDAVIARAALVRAELARRRGALDEAAPLFERAHRKVSALGSDVALAEVLVGRAELRILSGQYSDALADANDAVERYRTVGDSLNLGRALNMAGRVHTLAHRFEPARAAFAEARVTFETAGAKKATAEARFNQCNLLIHDGQLEAARTELEAILEICISVGDQPGIARTQRGIGQLSRYLGDLDRAGQSLETSLDIARRIGDKLSIARAYNGLGEVARAREDWATAREHYAAYVAAATGSGDPLSMAIGNANLGLINGNLGDWSEAADAFRGAISAARAIDNRPFLGAFLGCLGRAEIEANAVEAATTAIEEALEIDQEVEIREKDFLNALEGFAAAEAAPEALRVRALEVAAERWQSVGNDEAVARVKGQLATLIEA